MSKGEPIYKAGTKVRVVKKILGIDNAKFWEHRSVPSGTEGGTEGKIIHDVYKLNEEQGIHFPNYGVRVVILGEYVEIIE